MAISLRTRAVGLACVLVVAAACSSTSGDSAATTTLAPTTTAESTTTTRPATTTTAAATTTIPETTSTVPADPVFPLTGLPLTDEVAAARPALVVKIDNNAAARPQSGLNAADIVFEEIVEVQTRFAAVFHSQGSDPVGPIRSGRTQDIDLLGSFNRPLFAWSGGNANVTNAIENSDLVNLSAQITSAYQGGGYFRSSDRKAPHNLYAKTTSLWTMAPPGATPPPQQFEYRSAAEQPDGDPAIGVDLDMDTLAVGWRLDPASGLYVRTSGGKPHNDTVGQISTANVVIMVVDYQPSPADARSPEAQTVGTGVLYVYTGGTVQVGTWTRVDYLSPIVMTDASGAPILLTPGRTWVELAKADTFGTVTA